MTPTQKDSTALMDAIEYFDNQDPNKVYTAQQVTDFLVPLLPKERQDIEWLDETESTPTHGRTAEEIDISNLTDEFKADYIDACSDNRKLRKMLAEVTGLSRIATVEEYSSQFKAMEEHRTQPQEGKEEVECTHPYKECVMSDRVNKYGTPLTKCSVCGNDNICDEELMDESVNTF